MQLDASYVVRRFLDARRALSAAVITTAVWAMSTAPARAELPAIADVERAVLAADAAPGSLKETWAPVVRLLAEVNEQTPDPVLRLIKGHACLAVNANNQAWCLFLGVHTRRELEQWHQWTEQFSERHGDSPNARYLRGDASARLQRWEAALAHFAHLLESSPRHALALNASGVTRAQCGQLDEARKHFDRAATYTEGRLADAHANAGMLRIQSKDGAEGARRAFNRALNPAGGDASGSFALALHGKGCVELILGEHETASKNLEAALAAACGVPAAELMATNHLRYAVSVSGGDRDAMLAELDRGGTTLRRDYQDLATSAAGWQGTADSLRTMNWLPFNQHLADFAGMRSVERQEQIHSAFGNDGLRTLYSGYSSMNFRQEVKRVGLESREMLPHFREAERLTGNASLTLGASSFGSAVTAAEAPQTASFMGPTSGILGSAGLGAGVGRKINELRGDWAQQHMDFHDTVKQVFGPTMTTPGLQTPASPVNDAGGVRFSPADVVWDDGQWPFEAHYVLAYETIANLSNHSRTAQEGGRDDVQSE